MDANELRQLVERQSTMNIFDIFAILYSYCGELKFDGIYKIVRQALINQNVEHHVSTLENILPTQPNALEKLDASIRGLLVADLFDSNDLGSFDLQCWALLRAIDSKYDMGPYSLKQSNFSTASQLLNINADLGRVYPKQSSPIFDMIQQRIKAWVPPPPKPSQLRRGIDFGHYLRDRLFNLACVNVPQGYELDFGVLDSAVRFCFPPNVNDVRIALVPLLDEIKQIKIELFALDADGKKPWRFTEFVEPRKVADEAIAALQRLSKKGVTLVIFNELCMPQIVREAIAEGLKSNLFPNVKMVVAGSFHEVVRGECYNVSHILGPTGQELWQQKKMQPNTLMHYEAKVIPVLADLAAYDSYENISCTPRVVSVRDTPVGRMVVLICSDLLHDDPYRQMLYDLNVNFIVVPSMSAKVIPDFPYEAEKFAIRSQATTIISNSCAMARELLPARNKVEVSFAFLPGFPPLRWFRCATPAGPCDNHQSCEDFVLQLGSWPEGFDKS
ncbi:MAG: hypothetical protein HY662_02170 [Chloroflexi bacterium]|nr:hypothetical protein [Chloroflexota bacterium]